MNNEEIRNVLEVTLSDESVNKLAKAIVKEKKPKMAKKKEVVRFLKHAPVSQVAEVLREACFSPGLTHDIDEWVIHSVEICLKARDRKKPFTMSEEARRNEDDFKARKTHAENEKRGTKYNRTL